MSDLFRDFAISLDHSPLHFVLLNLWQRLDDSSFAFVRLPSAAFCAMAVVVVFEIVAAEPSTFILMRASAHEPAIRVATRIL